MYQVRHIFVSAENLAHLILISCFQDIPTLKQGCHASIKEILFEGKKKQKKPNNKKHTGRPTKQNQTTQQKKT